MARRDGPGSTAKPNPSHDGTRLDLDLGAAPWSIERGDGPLLATAIHAGHHVPPVTARALRIDDASRLREEDPFTDRWTSCAPNRVTVQISRFLVDLNRPRERAVYVRPEDAWNLVVWRDPPTRAQLDRSLALHDRFYEQLGNLIDGLLERHERVVVLDLHSYCHRRGGPEAPPDDPTANPEVNLGTGSVDRDRWGPMIDRFVADLRAAGGLSGPLDVRENVKFRGGHFPTWINRTFGDRACALAIEVKKTFMDEWTGELDRAHHAHIGEALSAAAARLFGDG